MDPRDDAFDDVAVDWTRIHLNSFRIDLGVYSLRLLPPRRALLRCTRIKIAPRIQ